MYEWVIGNFPALVDAYCLFEVSKLTVLSCRALIPEEYAFNACLLLRRRCFSLSLHEIHHIGVLLLIPSQFPSLHSRVVGKTTSSLKVLTLREIGLHGELAGALFEKTYANGLF